MRRKTLTLGVLTVLMLAVPASAQSLAARIDRANELFARDPQAALVEYESASELAPANSELLFNRACAHLALKQDEQAAELFKRLDAAASDQAPGAFRPAPALVSASRQALGRIEYRGAQAQAETDPQAAITALKRSERYFRNALNGAPAAAAGECRQNVELVQHAIKALQDRLEQQKKQEQQKQQQQTQGQQPNSNPDQQQQQENEQQQDQQQSDQQQNQDSQRQNLSDKLNELADRQRQAAEKSKDLADKAAQATDAKQKQQLHSEREKLAQEQQKLNEETEQAAEDLQKQAQQPNPDKKAADEMKQASQQAAEAQKSQNQAQQKLDQNDPAQASKDQQQAAEQLRKAADSAKPGQKGEDDTGKDEPSDSEQSASPAAQAKEQPNGQQRQFNVTAAQILDKERKEKEAIARFLRAMRGKSPPVDKDW